MKLINKILAGTVHLPGTTTCLPRSFSTFLKDAEGKGMPGGRWFLSTIACLTRHRKGTQPILDTRGYCFIYKEGTYTKGNLAAADPPTKLFGFTVLGIELFTDVAWTLLGALLVN